MHDAAAERINDLRILQMAQMYEEAFERFVQQMAAAAADDPEVKRLLGLLSPPDDPHRARLAAEVRRTRARLGPGHRPALQRAAVSDVVDVEKAAHEFYLGHRGRLHDPALRDLFGMLADEEAEHVRLAQEALRRLGDAEPDARAQERRLRFVLGEDDVPLREGVSDYGTPARRLGV